MDASSNELLTRILIYTVIIGAALYLRRIKQQRHNNIPGVETRAEWYDIQHFHEVQRIMSDHDMRDLLDEYIASKECSLALRMKTNDLILHYQHTRNSLSPQVRLLLQNLQVTLERLINKQPGSEAEWENAIAQADSAYRAYRTHYFELTGE